MSGTLSKESVILYDGFSDIGFRAGVSLKNDNHSRTDPYDMLGSGGLAGSKKVVVPTQVHGSEILFIGNFESGNKKPVDGILSLNPELCLTIRTADCLPLLLADPDSGLIGVVHMGWRGLAGGILENLGIAVKNLDSNLNRLYISLGPAIGGCCFEVGDEVAILFDEAYVTVRNNRCFLDIRSMVKDQLLKFGALPDRIINVEECTSCLSGKYYSFRRDGHAREQMISFICKI